MSYTFADGRAAGNAARGLVRIDVMVVSAAAIMIVVVMMFMFVVVVMTASADSLRLRCGSFQFQFFCHDQLPSPESPESTWARCCRGS